MRQISRWAQVLTAVVVVIGPGTTCTAETSAYINYWDLTSSRTPIELRLDQKLVTKKYSPKEIMPSQAFPAGQYAIWVNSQPRRRWLANIRLKAGQFYTLVLLRDASTVKTIVLNNYLAKPEPTLRLMNLAPVKVQVSISTKPLLEIKPGEQRNVPVNITNASAVGLVSVKVNSPTGRPSSGEGTFGVGPDHPSVLLIDQPGTALRLTRWQYDQCAVRIQAFNYDDACGHSD